MSIKLKLHEDWVWIVNHSWSMRFTFFAGLLSVCEVIIPHLGELQGIPGYSTIVTIVLVSAFVSRIVAQEHAAPTA